MSHSQTCPPLLFVVDGLLATPEGVDDAQRSHHGDGRTGVQHTVSRNVMGQYETENEHTDHIHHLDERVDGRTRCIFEGITDRVTGHGRLVSLGALASVMTVFDELLGVVPGAAGIGHEQAEEETDRNGASQETAERVRTE